MHCRFSFTRISGCSAGESEQRRRRGKARWKKKAGKEVIFWMMKQKMEGRGEIDRELVSAYVVIDSHPPFSVPVNQKVVLYLLHCIQCRQTQSHHSHSQTLSCLSVFTSFICLALQWTIESTSSFFLYMLSIPIRHTHAHINHHLTMLWQKQWIRMSCFLAQSACWFVNLWPELTWVSSHTRIRSNIHPSSMQHYCIRPSGPAAWTTGASDKPGWEKTVLNARKGAMHRGRRSAYFLFLPYPSVVINGHRPPEHMIGRRPKDGKSGRNK